MRQAKRTSDLQSMPRKFTPNRHNADKFKARQVVNDALGRLRRGSMQREQCKLQRMRVAAAAALLLLIVLAVLDAPPSRAPDVSAVTEVRTLVQTDGAIHVQIAADRNGHYLFAGRINGQAVKFFLDTGSSTIAIPLAVANHLKLPRGEASPVTTAAGAMLSYTTFIERIDIGGISAHKLRGAILSQMTDDRILLGMTFLREFELRQKDGELTIIKAPPQHAGAARIH